MLSKNQIKNITALHHKKFRREENHFIAEGEKVVNDLLSSGWNVKSVYGVQDYYSRLTGKTLISKSTEMILITDAELEKISALKSPQDVLAVAEIPGVQNEINYKSGLKLILDDVKDPGNLGTIIRIADWFGIDEIICSENSTDCFSPKVVQSAMGSLFKVSIFYENLSNILKKNISENKLPVYGTVLDGKNIFEVNLKSDGYILLGSESTGINRDLLTFITESITIPFYGKNKTDSLNVAIAAGIICSEFRRR